MEVVGFRLWKISTSSQATDSKHVCLFTSVLIMKNAAKKRAVTDNIRDTTSTFSLAIVGHLLHIRVTDGCLFDSALKIPESILSSVAVVSKTSFNRHELEVLKGKVD